MGRDRVAVCANYMSRPIDPADYRLFHCIK